MIRSKSKAFLVLAAVVLSMSACSTTAASDEVGLYYWQGSSDGDHFGFCIKPGQVGKAETNNTVYYLPAGVKEWNIGGEGSDVGDPIVASSKPQEGQPSGVEVQVWPKVTMKLNTFCDENGGVIRQFWENVGRSKGADTPEGWRKLMLDVVHTALGKSTRDITREYEADPMVGNVGGITTEIQNKIATLFSVELKRMTGGDYFCGPTFNYTKPECPVVEVFVKDVTYNDPGIQASRNNKQKAVEQAAADLAKAQGDAAALLAKVLGEAEALKAKAEGEVASAAKLRELYNNPAWVRLRQMELQLEAVKACSVQPNCKMIMGADGNIMITP